MEAVCHPIVSQAQACVGLFVLQHTQHPLCSLQHPSCSCEHLCPGQFICCGIHSERDSEQHTKSRFSFAMGMCRALQHSSSHLAKKNKQIEAHFDVRTSGILRAGVVGGTIPNLYIEPPVTAF